MQHDLFIIWATISIIIQEASIPMNIRKCKVQKNYKNFTCEQAKTKTASSL